MNAIVSGKVEKPEGSLVFKSKLIIDLSTTTDMIFEYYFDSSLYGNVKHYLRLVTVPNDEGIVTTLLTPVPYTRMIDVNFRASNPSTGYFGNFATDVIVEDNTRLFINVKAVGQSAKHVFTSAEIGTLETA